MLAAIHLPPAMTLVQPSLIERLYRVDATGTTGVLLRHRGALFAAMVVLSVCASVDPACRRAAVLAVAVSMVGFLAISLRPGVLSGPLRTIVLTDAVGLLPLAFVAWAAFRA